MIAKWCRFKVSQLSGNPRREKSEEAGPHVCEGQQSGSPRRKPFPEGWLLSRQNLKTRVRGRLESGQRRERRC